MVNQNQREILLRLYASPKLPQSFGSIEGLLRRGKKEDCTINRRVVKEFLEEVPSYTLHKLTQKRFLRRKIISSKPGVIASCDLMDVSPLSRFNQGFRYILVFIDVFSRFAQISCLKKKDGITVTIALEDILNSGHFDKLRRLNSDEGKEFYNKHVDQLLKSKGITLYSVSSREIKAAIAERFIRTLKGKMYRYMTDRNTSKYIDVIDDILDSYNNSPHRGLGLQQTPWEVHQIKDPSLIKEQFYRMYKSATPVRNTTISPLTVGQTVRIADEKRNSRFRRGFTVQNTFEIFKVRRIDESQNPTVYYLEDLQGEVITGVFYREELVAVKLPDTYKVEVVQSKTVRGRKKYLVKWEGYPDKFNSWIDESELVK